MANKSFTISENEVELKFIERYGEQEYKKFRGACATAEVIYNEDLSTSRDTKWTKLRIMIAYIAGVMDMDAIDEFLGNLGDYQEDYARLPVNAHTVFIDLGLACINY